MTDPAPRDDDITIGELVKKELTKAVIRADFGDGNRAVIELMSKLIDCVAFTIIAGSFGNNQRIRAMVQVAHEMLDEQAVKVFGDAMAFHNVVKALNPKDGK